MADMGRSPPLPTTISPVPLTATERKPNEEGCSVQRTARSGHSWDFNQRGSTGHQRQAVVMPVQSSFHARIFDKARNLVKNIFPNYAVALSDWAFQRMPGVFIYLHFDVLAVQ